MPRPATDYAVQYRELSAKDLGLLAESLGTANPELDLMELLKKYTLTWEFFERAPGTYEWQIVNQKLANDNVESDMRPVLKHKDTGKVVVPSTPFISLSMPPVTMRWVSVNRKSMLKFNKENMGDTCMDMKATKLSEVDPKFAAYLAVAKPFYKFLNEDRIVALVDNLDKHRYLTEKHRQLAKTDPAKAKEKLIELLYDEDNKGHFEATNPKCKIMKTRPKNRKTQEYICEQGRDIAEMLDDEQQSFTKYLDANEDRRIEPLSMTWPDGKKVEMDELDLIHGDGLVAALTYRLFKLNKSQHGGGLSVTWTLHSAQIITNGKPYNGDGNAAPESEAVNVFDVLQGKTSGDGKTTQESFPEKPQPAAPTPVDLTAIKDARKTIRGKRGAGDDRPKKLKRAKSVVPDSDLIFSDDDA